jgi:hypothetical protein
MSVDYLIVFNEGQYCLNEDEFRERLTGRFADARIGVFGLGEDGETGILEWTYGTGDERLDGRTAEDLSGVFIHARSSELGVFAEWMRAFLPRDVRMLLTNESYSFDFEIPIGATALDIANQLELEVSGSSQSDRMSGIRSENACSWTVRSRVLENGA